MQKATDLVVMVQIGDDVGLEPKARMTHGAKQRRPELVTAAPQSSPCVFAWRICLFLLLWSLAGGGEIAVQSGMRWDDEMFCFLTWIFHMASVQSCCLTERSMDLSGTRRRSLQAFSDLYVTLQCPISMHPRTRVFLSRDLVV